MTLEEMAEWVDRVNHEKGWFDHFRPIGDEIALIHSEVSEAYEEVRVGRFDTETDEKGKPIGFKSEIADVFIRLLDLCNRHEINLRAEFETKMKYNETRPYRHGGKLV